MKIVPNFQIFFLGGVCGLNTYILYQFLRASAILQQHGISRTSLCTTLVRRDNLFRTTKTESISSFSFLAWFRVITAVCCARSGVEREETDGATSRQIALTWVILTCFGNFRTDHKKSTQSKHENNENDHCRCITGTITAKLPEQLQTN